jgi:hypothetical protein
MMADMRDRYTELCERRDARDTSNDAGPGWLDRDLRPR